MYFAAANLETKMANERKEAAVANTFSRLTIKSCHRHFDTNVSVNAANECRHVRQLAINHSHSRSHSHLIGLHVFIDNYSVHKLSNNLSNSSANSQTIYSLGNTLDLLSNLMAVASSLHDYYYNLDLDFD